MKTAVVLQGGGPLGAFSSGCWAVLGPWLQAEGHELIAVAGASVGAMNAAVIACEAYQADLGAGRLQALWQERIARPMPLLTPPLWPQPWAGQLQAWAGWWSGVAWGNPALFSPLPTHWHPLAGLDRAALPLYSQQPMQRLLADIVGEGYASDAGAAPLLAVAATAATDGQLVLFDSDHRRIDAAVLAASAAIPLLFAPVEVDGQLYCDGEMNRASPVPLLVERLRADHRLAADEPLQLITLGCFSTAGDRVPRHGNELLDRALQWMLAGKLDASTPPGVARHIDVQRQPHAHDGISGQFDYSQARIRQLMDDGRVAAELALEALSETPPPDVPPATEPAALAANAT